MNNNTKRLFFKKSYCLSDNLDIRRVLSKKNSAGNGFCRLYCAPNTCSYPRFAVSINGKFANAVLRNRIKRLAREVFRLSQHNLVRTSDYLLIIPDNLTKKKVGKRLKNNGPFTFENMFSNFTALNRKLGSR